MERGSSACLTFVPAIEKTLCSYSLSFAVSRRNIDRNCIAVSGNRNLGERQEVSMNKLSPRILALCFAALAYPPGILAGAQTPASKTCCDG